MCRGEQFWYRDSSITLKQENNIVIGKYTLNKNYRAEFGFMPGHTLPKESLWKFKDSYTEGWMNTSFDDSQWIQAKKGNFPTPEETVVTRYYRRTVALGDLTGFAAFELAVNSRYGIIMYANGEEIYRKNLPATVDPTTPSSSDDGYYAFKRAFANRHLLGTSAAFAVEVHFPEGGVNSDDFDAFLNLVPAGTHRTFDGTVTGTHQSDYWDEPGTNAWDGARNHKWYMEEYPAYGTYTFNYDRADYVNSYYIGTGNYDSGRRPTVWKVEVSDDGSTWYLADYRSGITWTSHGETQHFTMPQLRRGYRMLKWTLLDTAGDDCEISELSFYADDIPPVPSNEIDYGAPKYFYPSQSVAFEPKAKGFYDMSISPSLPSGLSFNSNNGEIKGTASSALGTYTFTVTGKRYETGTQQYSGEVTIVLTNCHDDHRRLQITTRIPSNREAPYYRIMQGETEVERVDMRIIVGDYTKSDITARTQINYFCLPQGDYSIEFNNQHHIPWNDDSYVTLSSKYPDGTNFNIGTYGGIKLGASLPFSLRFVMSGETTEWTYLADGTVPDNWFMPDFAQEWAAIPSEAPEVAQSVQLFRRRVNLTDVADVDAYELRLKARAGIVVYLNGAEVYRRNVNGAVTASSTATVSSNSPIFFIFAGLVGDAYLHEGENVLAVAVVNADSTQRALDFSATMVLRSAVRTIAHGSTISAEASSGNANLLFNGNVNARWVADFEPDTYFQFTWTTSNYRMEQINKYCLVSAPAYAGNEPKSFTVSTTTDGETWTMVANHTNVLFTERQQRRCFYLANPVAIQGMKVAIYETSTGDAAGTVHLGGFDFLLENPDRLTATLSYTDTLIEGLVGAAITPLAPVVDYFTSFTVTPALPAGLYLGSSGIIFGASEEEVDFTSYTITATSVSGASSSAVVSISMVECRAGEQLTYVHVENTGNHGRYMNYKLVDPDSNEVMGEYFGFDNYDTTGTTRTACPPRTT